MMTAALAFVFVGSAFAQSTWELDKSHAKLGFSITHLAISEVEGSFKDFDVKVTSSKDDFTDAVVELKAKIASINTDNEGRDKHLQAPDYFDAAKYPELTFKSKELKKVNGKEYKLVGDLTLRGVTKQVELDVYFFGAVEHPYNKKTVAGFKVSGVINRKDFGIAPETPSAALGVDVVLRANLELIKQ